MIKHLVAIYTLIVILFIGLIISIWYTFGTFFKIQDLENKLNDILENGIGWNEELYIDDDAVLGDKNAPITIVEWSDYECPFCRKFYNEAFKALKSEYIDKGLVKFVYRDFPLRGHKDALPAAKAAECAREQGGDDVYFEFHNKIFEGQNEFGQGAVAIPGSSLEMYAKDLGLDESKFKECYQSTKYEEEIFMDLQAGVDAGIDGTPGFLIQGKLLSGAQPFTAFKRIIDKELERLKKNTK